MAEPTGTIITNQGATIVETPPVSTPEQQGRPDSIPYARFAEVVAQKNQAAERARALEEQLKGLANVITGQQVQPKSSMPQFQTAEELVEYATNRAEAAASAKISEAEQRLAQRDQNLAFGLAVENYFSANPNAAQLRNDMDAYTAGLNKPMQEAIKAEVASGRTDMLDAIYSLVATKNQGQIRNLADESRTQQANRAVGPDIFKSIRVGAPTFEQKIEDAKKTKDFRGVWSDVAADATNAARNR